MYGSVHRWPEARSLGHPPNCETGNTGIAFGTGDPGRTYRDLKEKGVEFAKDLTTEWFGTYAILRDLDGNTFWI